MLAIMVAKWVADFATHSLYHATLEIKCVPFLDANLSVAKLDCFSVRDIMTSPVVVLEDRVQVSTLLECLKSNRHNGFPVVTPSYRMPSSKKRGQTLVSNQNSPRTVPNLNLSDINNNNNGSSHNITHHEETDSMSDISTPFDNSEEAILAAQQQQRHGLQPQFVVYGAANNNKDQPKNIRTVRYIFKGIISREELEMLLAHPDHFLLRRSDQSRIIDFNMQMEYANRRHATKRAKMADLANSLLSSFTPTQLEMFVDLGPYVNTSAVSVTEGFSVKLAHTVFRSLGLRHLTVLNDNHEPVGIVTRKDLMGQMIEEKISEKYGQHRTVYHHTAW